MSKNAKPDTAIKATTQPLHGPATDRDNMTESVKWHWVWENAVKLNSVGFLAGTCVGYLLFRNVAARIGLAAFGGGFGFGTAYVDARYVFGHEVVANREWIASVKALPPTETS